MKIRLIWVGRTKEPFVLEGIKKYCKFIKPYADMSISEIKEEKGSDVQRMLEKEGERIAKLQVPYVLLDEKGRSMTSVEFAGFIGSHAPAVNFLIGGAYGVSGSVKEMARESIALSKMTLTHDLTRLLLLEQIYRAFTIMKNRDYHH